MGYLALAAFAVWLGSGRLFSALGACGLSDGTLEAFGPEARGLYRCAIDNQRFPAEDCADAFERSGRLHTLVHDVRTDSSRLTRHGRGGGF